MTVLVQVLDTEWLLSTLFDASLLSTSKPPATAALFLAAAIRPLSWVSSPGNNGSSRTSAIPACGSRRQRRLVSRLLRFDPRAGNHIKNLPPPPAGPPAAPAQ